MSVRLVRASLSLGAAERILARKGGGGLVVFAGRVRPDRRGRVATAALEYEVDRGPALERLRAIETTARRRFGAREVILWHRVGRVAAGEVAVITGAACAHRAEAFAAARYLIDELKATVPIWKEERGRSSRRPRRPRSRSAGR